jgi:hypothetical protein
MDTFLGMAFFICVGVVIFGIVKGFSWFAIKNALLNGPGFLAALYGIFYGATYAETSSSGWWLVAIIGGLFALICGYNMYSFFKGPDPRKSREYLDKLFALQKKLRTQGSDDD